MRFNFSSKIKGIARVSASNLLSLAVSLVTSFLLPYFISPADYGYWQLFVLYAGYVGFFAFGFNDGVHLNYATCSYDEKTASKFRSFKKILLLISACETLALIVFLTMFLGPTYGKFYIFLFSILNIIPVLVNGLFTYMNQATMRFKQYAWGNMLERVVFAVAMVVMILLGGKSYVFYIGAYTAARYVTIGYHFITSRMVFTEKPEALSDLKPEIVNNFKSGFALMIATLLNGSIIVGSRLLIENKFGIEVFGAYSFANHTLVIASQFVTAIASVFYPIMKRCKSEELEASYNAFDKSSTLVSTILLFSYYLAAVAINWLYPQYRDVLVYFSFVYPLFIFQCKSNLLIINTYKVKGQPIKLVVRNVMGIVIHLIFAFSAYWIFGTVYAIAVSVLISYCLWYYISQVMICYESKWKIRASMFGDLLIVAAFILVNLVIDRIYVGNFYLRMLIECGLLAVVIFLIGILFKKNIKNTIHQTAYFLKD